MIDTLLSYASGLLLLLGCFFMLTGAIGLLRFPDYYSRMHAAGITDTLATFLIISGLMLAAGWSLALFKLGLIMLFIFFTSPTASHALARSAQLSALRLPHMPAEATHKNNKRTRTMATSESNTAGPEPETAVDTRT
ncbi:monovalent cation/H(+) antiporter subunit G [uncultured Microbulbifer sp.]|uniref:monovalent cation/H(+) antiporter subunit G n=1 Tax=uncultured Microbulbifer sp. TaxID=348147 RepID=UPI002628A432|nr:monovalent cation/H(+) antiporter subunit G [uncultured Microbulbifer sp.]